MREIKHRLRSPIDKIVGYEKWYPGSMDSKNFYVAEPCWLYSEDGEFWNPKKIDHRMKDAFTGLKDKNGREIYEGDILAPSIMSDSNIDNYRMDGNKAIPIPMIVKWWDCGFDVPSENHLWEVIGNIHENPEALKEGGGM